MTITVGNIIAHLSISSQLIPRVFAERMATRSLVFFALLVAVSSAAQCPTCGILSSSYDGEMAELMRDILYEGAVNGSLGEYTLGLDACPGEPVTCRNGDYCSSLNFRYEIESRGDFDFTWKFQQVFMGCMLDIMADLDDSRPDIGDISTMSETEVCARMQAVVCDEGFGDYEYYEYDYEYENELDVEEKEKELCHYKCGDWQNVDVIDRPYVSYIVAIVFSDLPWLSGSSTTAGVSAATTTEAPTTTATAPGRARRSVTIPAAAAASLEEELAAEYADMDGFLSVKITGITDNGDGSYNVQFEIYFSSLNTPDEDDVRSAVDTFILSNSYAEDGQTPTYSFEAAKESDAGRMLASAFVLLAGLIALSA